MNELASHAFNWADYFIIAVILISTLTSLMRGFVSEAISLLTWIIAVLIAIKFASPLSSLFAGMVKTPSLRLMISAIVLFLAVLIVGSIISHLLLMIIRGSGLSGTNRLIGMVFGFARGVLLISILILFVQFTSVPKDPWWSNSQLIPYFSNIAAWLHRIIPMEVNHVSQYLSNTQGKQ